MVSTVLKLDGHETICRENCNTLDEDILNSQPQVILMDNWLPGTKGLDAIKLIKSQDRFNHIAIIFFSASSNSEEIAKEAGAEWILNKPFEMDDLLKTVKKAAEKK